MNDKPLHVRVAEILGWTDVKETYPQNIGAIDDGALLPRLGPTAVWLGLHPADLKKLPEHPDHRSDECVYAWENEPCECRPPALRKVYAYDTDWAATGPLIERYGFRLHGEHPEGCSEHPGGRWVAWSLQPAGGYSSSLNAIHAKGHTPLVAICNLIIALAEAGKLK